MTTQAETVALSVREVSKRFPGVQALSGISLDVFAGEVLGLVGENGAGKSTLIKIMAGVESADDGEIVRSASLEDPAGIAVIYQELAIVPAMSAVSNVFLSDPPRRGLRIDRKVMRERFRELAGSLGARIDPNAEAGSLSVAQQQTLEIMRALARRHRVLIMDEPTASLGAEEREHLYRIVGRLKAQGTAVVYISHDLDEVLRLCDRIAVMRDGRLVRVGPGSVWSKHGLVEAMVGDAEAPQPPVRARPTATPAMTVEKLRVSRSSLPISFTLHRGEILGIAGLVGSGRTRLLRALFGANPEASGRMIVGKRTSKLPLTVRAAVAQGLALVPEDRKGQGLVLGLPGYENMTLTDLGATSTMSIVSRARQLAEAVRLARFLGFSANRLRSPARQLSGGNQQKLVIGKWLHKRPAVLLLDEPTRGIDVHAKSEVFRTVRQLSYDGMSVILVSSELEELVDNCDRILVMSRRHLIGEVMAAEASVNRLLAAIFAVDKDAA